MGESIESIEREFNNKTGDRERDKDNIITTHPKAHSPAGIRDRRLC